MSKLGRNPFVGTAGPKGRVIYSENTKVQASQPKASGSEPKPRLKMKASAGAERGLCPAARQVVRLAAGAVVLGFKGTILAREAIRTTFGL